MAQIEREKPRVAKFQIIKPLNMEWDELGELLQTARYRVFRLANLVVSEAYLGFHLWRTGRADTVETAKVSELNKRLGEMLKEEGCDEEVMQRFSSRADAALPASVTYALSQYKLRAVTARSKWREVIRGQASLPTFRLDMSVPVRCDKPGSRRLERLDNGDVAVDLRISVQPYPRVLLATNRRKIGESQAEILDRLLDNPDNAEGGYRQRCFEVKRGRRDGKWWLYVTYDFPKRQAAAVKPEVVVGVDVGVSTPLYAAVSNGHARLGHRDFAALGHRIRSLKSQVIARRRAIQRGGRRGVSAETARSGHGRKRALQATEGLQGRINDAYKTLNHQMSRAVVEFAKSQGAGVIQFEDLDGLKDALSGTFIGATWQYHDLLQYIEYKAEEAGIAVRAVNPKYTSRRCSKCGHIHADFDRAYRDREGGNGRVARFKCPACEYEADPDYNAARNIATIDIGQVIKQQCEQQGLSY